MPDNRVIDKLDHKIRETLNGIKGYLDLILEIYDDPLTPRQKKSLTIMRQQTDNLFQIIKEAQERIVEVENLQVLKAAAVTLGHEVNNPLQTISMAASILKKKYACPGPDDQWDLLFINIKKINTLTTKFASLNRVQTKEYAGGEKMIDLETTSLPQQPEE